MSVSSLSRTIILTALALTASAPAGADDKASSTPIEYGIGLRLRAVRIPKGLLELVMERAPGPVKSHGIGVELSRRRGDLELQLGAEFEYLQPAEGVYIESNADVAAGDEADFILSPKHNGQRKLGWFTVEFTFLNHAAITDYLAIRYGAGLGIGIVTGELGRYDVICNGATNRSPEPGCVPPGPPFDGAGTYSDDGGTIAPGTIATYDLPPVFPVVNAIVGLQLKPFKKMTINVEGGIRTVPFFGVSTSIFF
ncbi:MAG: hypothetical protein H0T89_21950 [Deltaproteobacteria bacterium]|nr:hypothetical protein [Deltaproteobacteria bacterium]MDQ3297827.1 hypothetical protein [Myxococcota bacterium]